MCVFLLMCFLKMKETLSSVIEIFVAVCLLFLFMYLVVVDRVFIFEDFKLMYILFLMYNLSELRCLFRVLVLKGLMSCNCASVGRFFMFEIFGVDFWNLVFGVDCKLRGCCVGWEVFDVGVIVIEVSFGRYSVFSRMFSFSRLFGIVIVFLWMNNFLFLEWLSVIGLWDLVRCVVSIFLESMYVFLWMYSL